VFNSRRTQWFEDEAQDREYKRIAMSTVQSYGGRIPEDSWVTIYQELHNGRTIENIREDIDARGFVEITPDPATTTPTEPASAEVAQTEGMLAEGQPVPTTPDDGLEIPADAMAVGTSGADDLWSRVKQQESGNRQTDDEGSTIESEAGALGIAQVMPATAMDPGFGMKSIFDVAEEQGISVPVRDENAARALLANGDVNEAFGRQYFDTMLDRYDGDQEKALIAYNAGPDVADNFTGDRSTLPQETQGYLANILGNSATTERSVRSWGFSPEERAGVIRELGIDNNMFDMVMNGFEPEFPELRYAWGVSPDEEEAAPEWADIANVREGNYIAFAEAARLDGDETQAALIEAVGA